MKSKGKMAGRRVLITGAGTGIGREMALEFARQGATVALHYSHSCTGAETAVKMIRRAGGKAELFRADFNDVAAVKQLAADALKFLGRLDVLINNAGITMNRPFEEVTPEQFDALYNVNVRAQFFLTQALAPVLARRRGAVINLSSIHALGGVAGHSVYAGTKGAIIAYTRELAIELAPQGIRINTIVPGAVSVENHRKVMSIDPDDIGTGIPAGFAGQPIDVAKLAVFLASDDARYILGQTIVIDGGTTAWFTIGEGFKRRDTTPFGRGYVPGV
jgi:NAD(P)-dependent dehydrogenase (short-subunit alcohol dehydrogenase family)